MQAARLIDYESDEAGAEQQQLPGVTGPKERYKWQYELKLEIHKKM